uniref:Uncharacterized protein n=1 Tax=Anguilla anguilla TaxID=7936 RepID=A0A0E9WR92_ANGAN
MPCAALPFKTLKPACYALYCRPGCLYIYIYIINYVFNILNGMIFISCFGAPPVFGTI